MVEGVTDRGAIRKVANRLNVNVRIYVMNGNKSEKLKGIVNTHAPHYTNFILMKDLHRLSEHSIRQIYNTTCRQISMPLRDRLTLIIVKYEIEAWFLADIDALNKTFHCNIMNEFNNPEEIEKPSEELDLLLMKKCGRRYYKIEKYAERIMENADYEKISEKVSSFQQLINCIS